MNNQIMTIFLCFFLPTLVLFHIFLVLGLRNKLFWIFIDYLWLLMATIGVYNLGESIFHLESNMDKNYCQNKVEDSYFQAEKSLNESIAFLEKINRSEAVENSNIQTIQWLKELKNSLVKNKVDILLLKDTITPRKIFYKLLLDKQSKDFKAILDHTDKYKWYYDIDHSCTSLYYASLGRVEKSYRENKEEDELNFKFLGFVLLSIGLAIRITKVSADLLNKKSEKTTANVVFLKSRPME